MANVSTAEAALALLYGLALMLVVYYGRAVVYMLTPARAGKLLGEMSEWIVANSRMVEIVTGLGFGALFPGKGLSVLL